VCVQIEEFIVKLGIRSVSVDSKSAEKPSPVRHKLKTAKVQQLEDTSSSEHRKKSILETKKTGKSLQNDELTSAITRDVDWITGYQPRKYLLIKPGGKWYHERVSHSLFQRSSLFSVFYRSVFLPLTFYASL